MRAGTRSIGLTAVASCARPSDLWLLRADYTIMANDRYRCAGRRSKGTCGKDHTISRPEVEAKFTSDEGLYRQSMKAGLTELKAEEVSLVTQQAPSEVVANVLMHPKVATIYRPKVRELIAD
jgi:hypothetical protein